MLWAKLMVKMWQPISLSNVRCVNAKYLINQDRNLLRSIAPNMWSKREKCLIISIWSLKSSLMIWYKRWKRNIVGIKKKQKEKIHILVKTVLNENTLELDMEAQTVLISALVVDSNNDLRSSASTNTPNNNQIRLNCFIL